MITKTVTVLFAGLIATGAALPAARAQTPPADPPVIALEPTPHPAGCADFVPVGNGMWRPVGAIRIRNMVTMGPGVSFREGVAFAGIDIAQQLNQSCKVPN
jgi:hypothetical protein